LLFSTLFDEGSKLLGEGKYKEAISVYDKALAIDPNYENALNNKCVVLDIISNQNITSSERPLSNKTTDSNSTTKR
jgi:tetratricopeptide (TPR) repeat protein